MSYNETQTLLQIGNIYVFRGKHQDIEMFSLSKLSDGVTFHSDEYSHHESHYLHISRRWSDSNLKRITESIRYLN